MESTVSYVLVCAKSSPTFEFIDNCNRDVVVTSFLMIYHEAQSKFISYTVVLIPFFKQYVLTRGWLPVLEPT